MHILVIPSWYNTPTNPIRGSFFREQAHALRRAGHTVGMLVPPSRLRTWNGLAEVRAGWRTPADRISVYDDDGIMTYRIAWWGWLASLLPGRRLALAERVFERYCREQGRPDVIHAHSLLYAGYIAAYLREKYGIPAIVTENSSVYLRGPVFPDQVARLRYILQQMDAVLAVNPVLANALRRYLPEKSIGLIPNSTDVEFFRPAEGNLPASPFTFAIIANLNANKGVDLLLKAFAQAFAGADTRLQIAGDGAERAKLEALADTLGIASRITFLGRLTRQQVRDRMQQVHSVVSSSYYEMLPFNLIEALACGKPLVATRTDGAQVLVNEQNGLLVPTGDVDALAAALKQMRERYADYDPASIRADCVARFSDAALLRQLEDIYRSVVDRQPETV